MTSPETKLTTTQLIHDFDEFVGEYLRGGAELSTMQRLYLAAVFLAAKQGRVTADDMRRVVSLPDRDGKAQDGRIRGGALAQLMRKGILATIGSVTTTVRRSNGRQVGAYVLTPQWRARWLADDRLPVFNALTNLPTPHVDDAANVPQDEILAILSDVHTTASTWSRVTGTMFNLDDPSDPDEARMALGIARGALDKITKATERWRRKDNTIPAATGDKQDREQPPAPAAEGS